MQCNGKCCHQGRKMQCSVLRGLYWGFPQNVGTTYCRTSMAMLSIPWTVQMYAAKSAHSVRHLIEKSIAWTEDFEGSAPLFNQAVHQEHLLTC